MGRAEERSQKRPGSGGAGGREKPKTSWLGWGGLKREAKNVLARVGRAEERSQNVLAQVGWTEERSQKRPGSGAGWQLLVRLKVNSLSLRHTFSFSSQKQLASKDPFVRNVFDFALQPSSKFTLGYFPFTT